MANRRRSPRRSLFSKNLIFWLIVLVLIIAGYFLLNKSDIGADTINPNISYQEEFTDLELSPNEYKVQLKDTAGNPLSAETLAKIEVTSKITGKDCGSKGAPSHKDGGCFTITNPVEQKVTIDGTGTMIFEDKLIRIHQTITYKKTGKQKVQDYYSGAIGSGDRYIVWKKNQITIKDKVSGKEITTSNPEFDIPVLASIKTNQQNAAQALTEFNNTLQTRNLEVQAIADLGSNGGTPAPDSSAPPANPNISKTSTYTISFTKGSNAVPNQKYKTTEKYKTCEMTESKEVKCSKTLYTDGATGTADANGAATFTTNLVVVGDNYFVGVPVSATKFKVYKGMDIIATDDNGKKIGQTSANSPFYRNVSHIPLWKVMDATERSKDKDKMVKKFDDYIAKKYQVKIR